MTPEERKQLYIEIRQQGLYTSKNWEKNNLGENMVVLSKVICGFWKPIYLVDDLNKTAMRFMDNNEILLNVSEENIDWDSLNGLAGIGRAKCHSAHYPTHIRGFKNWVAEVEWQINPDGMYFMTKRASA